MEASATLTIPRMFSDAAGECRFDQTDIPLVMKEYAPPAAPVAVSAPMPTGQCVFMRIPPGFVGDQGLGHVSEVISDVPFEAYLIALT